MRQLHRRNSPIRTPVESPVPGRPARWVRGAGWGNGPSEKAAPRPGPTPFHRRSYGFRPMRRAHDAIAKTRLLTSKSYEWIVEGDITACFDEIDHTALMDRVRDRIADRRVLALVKALLKAGILGEDGQPRATDTGTPRGSILSPLLSNVALSVLDEHFARIPSGPADATAVGRSWDLRR
ncbi:reverse transcriptase domain-containing protein [Solwaraspora sp. WMMA2080]|nr:MULTISPECIES: reverse transcriptase domain-containing protein [unclassified Solwaraspora]WBC00270.1 reverse transcriptase domain-containing protein [Solwaraspora sp. WMMA2059]WBC23662.1 reverse transcriptase domain-containing protein [Solwaraspora sp. WMMA2080]